MQKSLLVLAAYSLLLLAACGGSSSNPSPQVLNPGGDDTSGDTGSDTDTESLSLLVSRRGGHYWHDYCADKPDNTAVPADPREMVVPGVNENKAVLMNAWWQTCQEDNQPANCGELRQRAEHGLALVAAEGRPGAASFFSGDASESGFSFPADAYAEMWKSIWGLSERPLQYDELVAQRWGMPLSVVRNPYPLPGEDPNLSDGGSGQLPMGVTQLREANGSWTGQLNVTCSICHGGAVGTADEAEGLGAMYGNNSLSDITVMFSELARLAPQQAALAIISQNKVRGTGNITNFQLFGTLTLADYDTIPSYLTIQAEPSTGTEDPPVWWNVGSRSAKFYDGGQVVDAKRIELSFHFPDFFNDIEGAKQWILDNQQDSDAWISSLKSPPWPESVLGSVDRSLAEAGAVLFHAKNLWAPSLNNPTPRPEGGNGSCASCHGAYSPRYVNDPTYLDSPLLDGVAAYITPINIIDTDPARLNGNSPRVAEYSKNNWFAYSEGPYNDDGVSLCGNWADESLRGDRELGYLAPPLYGVWATAPYFHNGSVPNIDGVLNPAVRPTIWRRLSKDAPTDLAGQVVMGFDYSLKTGYDAEKIGWRYDELECGSGLALPLIGAATPGVDCNPLDSSGPVLQDALSVLWGNGGLAWNLLNVPIVSDQQIEERKIYNTKLYSQGNGGHEFTSVLNDTERRAIKEYLKTL
ncbi:rubber dioxygenase RoxB [Zhongshania arctica]|uniref:Cytochrome c domain-containing protein n=1 Tax=Zhongshania arctica TaxID=3238302 RepID=A0ABV3TUL4_9GAMM